MQAEELIEALELAPHPEGGWYRETWRSEAAAGERAAASAVYYVRLGGRANQGEQPQLVVPRGWWQSAQPAAGEAGYSFLSCIVAPAFDFEAFVIAEPGWEPGQRSTEGDR